MYTDIIIAGALFVMVSYIVLTFNYNSVIDYSTDQIDKEKANEVVNDKINLTYNELHSLELGVVLAFAVSFIYMHLPLTATVIFIEIMLIPLGISLHSFVYRYADLPAYAFAYTVRSEPWYFLIPFILVTCIGVLVLI